MLVSDMEDQGYACVKYLSDFDECKRAKESIERSKCIQFNGQPVKCRITKVYNLYFMRLATILIIVMNKYCFRKNQLCHCLTETVFKKTSLARVYVLNEHVLWKSIRNEMIRRILVVSKFSDAGRKYAAQLYLSNINSICVNYVQDTREGTCCFHRLMDQILRCPSAAVYLVENGFLCKMIDVISNLLKAIGVEAGADLILIYERDRNKLDDVRWIFKIETLIIYCLRASFNEIGSFAKFKSQVADAGRRLVQVCFEFDDMQPMNWLFKKYNEEMYQFMYLLYDDIFIVIPEIVTLLISYNDIATEILELFLKRFAEDIDRISEDSKDVPVVQKIIKYCNIYKDSFSIFNISHRVFIDIFMDCCVKDTLSQSINDKVFGDVKMLMWIARPAVTTISYFSA
ncbi:hypothetical protein RF11_10518 [Thelohanellus kitauei]|uniref:Uncharacterized protein n=1 Tax=Thelohanellus kitauei TaxID=669202 RepID=A0A0C2M8N2_THEKT|nr:hypothetical protein RF11_10518 [Thelohanellus kitauei]